MGVKELIIKEKNSLIIISKSMGTIDKNLWKLMVC